MNKLHISTSLVVGIVIGALATKWWLGRKKGATTTTSAGFTGWQKDTSTGGSLPSVDPYANATGFSKGTTPFNPTFGASKHKLGDKDKYNQRIADLKKQGLSQ